MYFFFTDFLFFYLNNVDVENYREVKGFGFMYIYIYIYRERERERERERVGLIIKYILV